MTLFHLFLVAVIQGITEFLPISSSGHLILLPQLTGLQDQGQAVDVAVHVGTLGAVVLYFWRDVRKAIIGVPKLLRWQMDGPEAWLALYLAVATIPAVIFGLLIKLTGIDDMMRSVAVIGWTMLLFGILLYWADQRGPVTRKAEEWSLKHAIILGLWQAVALIPGTSRSGITITGARFLGYGREEAARISMLMSIPVILASGLVLGLEVAADANADLARDGAIAAGFAFVSAFAALAIMMRLLRSVSFTPYVIYRIVFGLILLGIVYT
ncbi:MAG: undecaprenyl-diphosphatase [Dinoroseobacter sp.]|jgi:undecaprenyl-diphosphatase